MQSINPLKVKGIVPNKCIYAGAALLDDGFMELLRAKTLAERPYTARKNIKDKDYNRFAHRIWHGNLKENHSVDMEDQIFDLPLMFIGNQVTGSTMAFTA